MTARAHLADVVALPRGEPDDVELVRRACDGDVWAHEAIYRRYVQRVARVGQQLLHDATEIDDIVQETFLIAFETLDSLAEPAALRGWLTRIAVHRVHRRFRWRRLTRLWARSELATARDGRISQAAGPEVRTELALIDQVLQKLPLKLRTPWILRRVLGDSLEDVALACACSLATAKRRIAEVDAQIDAHLAGGT